MPFIVLMVLGMSFVGNVFSQEDEMDISSSSEGGYDLELDEQEMSYALKQSFQKHLSNAELIYSDIEVLNLLNAHRRGGE
jgi:hypothetical protein